MRAKFCRKCATDQPHPFRHWHVWCSFGRHVRIFRGPCCGACTIKARALAADIFDDLRREGI